MIVSMKNEFKIYLIEKKSTKNERQMNCNKICEYFLKIVKLNFYQTNYMDLDLIIDDYQGQ